MGGAEDHGVDVCRAQWRADLAHDGDGTLVELLSRLDDRGERGAGNRVQGHVRIDRAHRFFVGAAGDRGGRGEQPDAAAARGGHRSQSPGADDAEHVDSERRLHHPPLQVGQRGSGGRVARDHEQLGAPPHELVGDLRREARELARRALSVGEAPRVTQIQEVLLRKRDEQLVQDRQPAHARVEHADRARAGVTCTAGGARHPGHHSRALRSRGSCARS